MPYTSAGCEGTTPESPCSNPKRKLSLYQVVFYVVVKYDSYGHNRLELNHILGCFSQIRQDEHEITLLLPNRKEGTLLIGHGRLYGTLRYASCSILSHSHAKT